MTARLPHRAFLALAGAQPNRSALHGTYIRLTAGELAHQALQTATVLAERGISLGDAVGVSIHDPARCIPAVLGVLIAGACCIPLTEGLPARRRQSLLCNHGARVLLTDRPQPRTSTTTDPTPLHGDDPYDVAPTWSVAQLPLVLCRGAEPLRLTPARRPGRIAWIYPPERRPADPAQILTHRDVARAAERLTARRVRPRQVRLLIPNSSPLWPYAVLPALANGIPLLT
ncbi:AMP-binding protein [Streptomyces sp. NPDC047123]|uniref:AMP-binding protein n=1 Tax=Streptomyces sp. NPDC047123 TaxID=3155622 RepID=UPI0033F63006